MRFIKKQAKKDYKGISFQRYEEPPHKIAKLLKEAIKEQNDIKWVITDTSQRGQTRIIKTKFTQVQKYRLRLKATVKINQGTLVFIELQRLDTKGNSTIDYYEWYKEYTKPIFNKLNKKNLNITTINEYSTINSFFDRLGFFASLDVGGTSRFNGYGTSDTLRQDSSTEIEYDSRSLTSYGINARSGLLGVEFAEFSYEKKPEGGFAERAYEFNEDRSFGLERYTYGVNLLPLWQLLLPEDKPNILTWITRILSARFRVVNELTKTTASLKSPSIAYPSFELLESGSKFGFETEYRFRSVSVPIWLFPGGNLNLGIAYWKYSRVYAIYKPLKDGKQHIFNGGVYTGAPILEFHYEVHESSDNTLGRTGEKDESSSPVLEGLRLDLYLTPSTQDEDGNTFYITGEGDTQELLGRSESMFISHYNVEFNASYPIKLLKNKSISDLSIRVGAEYNIFSTHFDGYHRLKKRSWIFRPWARLSLEIN